MMSFEVFQVDNFQKLCLVDNSYNLFDYKSFRIALLCRIICQIVIYNYNITQKFGILNTIIRGLLFILTLIGMRLVILGLDFVS